MLRIFLAGLLGGALVFGAGAVAHSPPLQLEGRMFSRVSHESEFRDFFSKKTLSPGIYAFPSLPEGFEDLSKEEQEKEWTRRNERYKLGPSVIFAVAPLGEEMMSVAQLLPEFVSNVLAALIVAFVLTRTSPDTIYPTRWFIVLLFGLFTWISTSASFAIWYRFPWLFILDGLYCSLLEWGVAGIVIAAIARAPAPAAKAGQNA